MYRILDLDNCIADDVHRFWLIDRGRQGEERYADYHAAAASDALCNRDLLQTKEELIILTGRPVRYAEQTINWLRKHGVAYKYMIMRNKGDLRSSAELKRQHVEWLIELYDVSLLEITSAFDDQQSVVDTYRSIGIPAEQRFINFRG